MPQRRELLLVSVLWLLVIGSAGSFTSCYGHNCDPSNTRYGLNPGEGDAIDADHWESSPSLGNAIPYTRERTIFFEVPEFEDRIPITVETFISADENPTSAGGNETSGSGNLAEVSGKGPGRFAVKNDTCADYFLRVVVFFAPRGQSVGSLPDSGVQEASDASLGVEDTSDASP